VEYVHDGGESEEDLFRFTVVVGDVQTSGSFPIMVDEDSLHHPPDVIRNQMLKMKEGQTAQITRNHLLLQHPSLNEEEIVFIVTSPPKHGFLQVQGMRQSGADPVQFSQGDVNRGTVEYVHTESPHPVSSDQFVFDVDSDTRALRNLVFSIEIAPTSLPIDASDLVVAEGGTVSLTAETLKPAGLQYEGESLLYEVMEIPVHGYILNSDKPKLFNMAFTSSDLAALKVTYQHDDSESLNDSFAVVGSRQDGSLKSQLITVKVKVTPQDDQPPRVVINKVCHGQIMSVYPNMPHAF